MLLAIAWYGIWKFDIECGVYSDIVYWLHNYSWRFPCTWTPSTMYNVPDDSDPPLFTLLPLCDREILVVENNISYLSGRHCCDLLLRNQWFLVSHSPDIQVLVKAQIPGVITGALTVSLGLPVDKLSLDIVPTDAAVLIDISLIS
jgi:hypothetical protein